MESTIKVNGTTFCSSCYSEASKDARGNEELGFLLYDSLHYELRHKEGN